MARSAVQNFMKQQGFGPDAPERLLAHFRGLQFQPIVVGSLMLVGIVTQSAPLFLALSAVLWLNALAPQANPFEAVYNRFVARPRGRPELRAAPLPRRFAQGMAAAFALIAGAAILQGWTAVAYTAQGFIAVAFSALLFGKFCLGAYVYHLLKGNAAFANGTCPWSD